ncbi:MAG: MqnA/MqnD/SBP family protein [bacterium]
MYQEIFNILKKQISGEKIKNTLSKIFSSDKYFSFDNFEKTALICANLMKEYGLKEVEIIPFKTNEKYGDWIMPPYWKAEQAELKIIFPIEYNLADYQKNPHSLIMFSSPTPSEGIKTEVVLFEDLKNYSLLKGKIAFTDKSPHEIENVVLNNGGIGIISDNIPENKIENRENFIPDATVWRNDCFGYFKKQTGFGFSISFEKGKLLRNLLKQEEKVVVYAKVKTEITDGKIYAVTGLISGETKQEILGIAHLYEPGANDNASGVSVLIEIANLIKKLGKPKRGIRLFFSFELFGIMAYLSQKRNHSIIAGINLDMVGEDQEKTKSILRMISTPAPVPYFTNYLLKKLLFDIANLDSSFKWAEKSFDVLDNIISDPMIGIPTQSLINWPDLYYHTSLDTMDKVSEKMLFNSGLIAGTYLSFLSKSGFKEAYWFVQKIYEENKELFSLPLNEKNYYLKKNVKKMLFSTLFLVNENEKSELEQFILKTINEKSENFIFASMENNPQYKLIPKRKIFGPLSMFDLSEQGKEDLSKITDETFPWNKILNYILFWTDGKKSIEDIFNLVKQEKKLDISSISSIEYVKNENQYFLIDDISLNSKGYTKSVIFFSHKKIDNLSNTSIVLSPFSATSSIVLKILLNYFKNKNIEYTNKINKKNSLLLIGDDALKYENKIYPFQYDLGNLWFEIFKKPIVFALWAVNKKSLLNEKIDIRKCADTLLESKKIFKNEFNQIAKKQKKIIRKFV